MSKRTRPLLIASEDFGERMSAERVAAAIARGLVAEGLGEPEQLPLRLSAGGDIRGLLDSLDFDRRMRAAGAVVIAARRLHESTLNGSATFEIATRARQSGVPAFAVTAEDDLDAFDARILDLQRIFTAHDGRGLAAAGRKLARLGTSLPQL